MTFILVAHIVLMLISATATAGMTIAAATSHVVRPAFIRSNVAITVTGILCGIALLFTQPIGAKCALLFTYMLAFAATYAFVSRRNQSLLRPES